MSDIPIDIKYFRNKIQSILNKEHNDHNKRIIKDYPERLNFACPYCGDSEKSSYKKRGNFYIESMRFKCFNCDKTEYITKFLDDYNEKVDIDDRVKIYNYIDQNVKFSTNNSSYVMTELDKLIDLDEMVEYFNNKKNSWLYDIKPVQYNSNVYQYLKHVRLIDNFSQIYQGIYRIIKDGKVVYSTRVMISINMLLSDKKVLGIQLRNLESDKNKRFYKIVDFETLYNYMNPTNLLDDLEAISYNKLSHFYNILNINFEDTVTIFEGFLDSLFYPNSIGLIGTNSGDDLLNFLIDSGDELDLQFFYDYDATGVWKSTQLLKKGYKVFLWKLLFKKLIDKSKDKYKSKQMLNGITDLNELAKRAKNPNVYKSLKLENFFSNDEFDLLYLDKLTKKDGNWIIKR